MFYAIRKSLDDLPDTFVSTSATTKLASKAMSNRMSAEPLIRMLDFARRFSLVIDWTGFKHAEDALKAATAFVDSAEVEERGIPYSLKQGYEPTLRNGRPDGFLQVIFH